MTDLSERSYVGALLHLPAARVIVEARQVRDDDLTDPRLRIVYRLAVDLASAGTDPDPARVHGHARTTGTVTSSDLPALTALLVDLHSEVPLPGAVTSYGRAIVEASVRRRITAAAERWTRAADDAPLDVLTRLVTDETAAVAEAVDRLAAWPLEVVA
jgi:replicative DNA helicase